MLEVVVAAAAGFCGVGVGALLMHRWLDRRGWPTGAGDPTATSAQLQRVRKREQVGSLSGAPPSQPIESTAASKPVEADRAQRTGLLTDDASASLERGAGQGRSRTAPVSERPSAHDGLTPATSLAATDTVELKRRLAEVAGLSVAQAEEELRRLLRQEAHQALEAETAELLRQAEKRVSAEAAMLLATTAQRLAGDFVGQATTSTVRLPSDELKGRIIGREGRNVRVFEQATGVDVIVDDTPKLVLLSCFDSTRREVARRAMEELVADGRIHPAHIEETVARHKLALQDDLPAMGRVLAQQAKVGPLDEALARLMGQATLVDVDGQTLSEHALESAEFSARIADELGGAVDPQLARRAGFLHDVGMLAPHVWGGDHVAGGCRLLDAAAEDPALVQAVGEHHLSTPTTLLGLVVQVADRLSRCRPGARDERLAAAGARMRQVEELALNFAGVEEAWVIQSGNEVRVMVDLAAVSGQTTVVLSQEIAAAVRAKLVNAGDIRVHVVRRAEAVVLGTPSMAQASASTAGASPPEASLVAGGDHEKSTKNSADRVSDA